QNAMFQSFPTAPGTVYNITLGIRLIDLDSIGIPIVGLSSQGPAVLTVFWNGQIAQDFLIQNRATWSTYSLNLTAEGATSEVAFAAQDYILVGQTFQFGASVFIDNVSAIAVPEPPAFALISTGVLAGFTIRRSRRWPAVLQN